MVKLVDIARATNVSNAAVSYAFSSDPAKRAKLSPATRERILRTAERFNYRPSLTGRGFALRRSYNIALLMPLSCTRNMSAHYLGMFHGVSAGIAGSDYNLSVFFGCDEKFLGSVRNDRVDAVVVLARGQNPEVFGALAALEIPIVFLNRPAPPECPDAASCSSDYREWLTSALDDFEDRGIRRCTLYYREDRCGDREVKALFEELCSAKSISCRSLPREAFSAPAGTSQEEGFVFCGSSPEILAFLRRAEEAVLPKVAAGGFSMDRPNDGNGNSSAAARRATAEDAPLTVLGETRKDAPGVSAVPPGGIPYVILSEMNGNRRIGLAPGKVFSHDSEAIGRTGVEMLLAELERGRRPKEKRIPLLRCDGPEKASMLPEF